MKPTVYLGADHGGYRLKERLREKLADWGYETADLGDVRLDSHDDYPLYALMVASRVAAERARAKAAVGILACRSAGGMAIAANKVPGIRAVAAPDRRSAIHARTDNDANVLALAGDYLNHRQVAAVAKAWLDAKPPKAGKHLRRIGQVERFETDGIDVVPGVLERDTRAANAAAKPLAAVSDWVHVDVADGALVPESALAEPSDATGIRINVKLEVHLMVEEPARFVTPWVRTGAKRLIAHVEADGIREFLRSVNKRVGVEAWVAVDAATPVARLKPLLGRIDGVTVMAVTAGRSGQEFQTATLTKVAKLKELKPNLPVEVDGGINQWTAPAVRAAGADRVVATSFLKRRKDVAGGIGILKGAG
ncbi:MAG TPA: RpiB/LacA/LacB family sugar-phosphate isomerase [Patescibacteria group bacterium]